MKRAGQTLSTYVTAPVLGLGAASLKSAGDFEASMNKIAALAGLTANKTDKSFQKIRDEALRLGKATEFSSNQAATAFEYFAQKGFEVEEMLGAVEPTLNLATSAGANLGEAAQFTSDIMNQFGKDASEIPGIVDKMAQAFTSSGASFDSLRKSFQYVGPTASQLGVSITEATSALAALGDTGIRSSKAGTALNAMLTQMTKKSDKLGVQVMNAQGEMRPLETIFSELADKGMSFKEVLDILGIRGNRAFATIQKDGAKALRKFSDMLGESSGKADEVAGKMRQGLNFQMKQLMSSVENLGIAFANSGLLSVVSSMVESVRHFVNWLGSLSQTTKNVIGIIGGIAAAIGPVLVAVGSLGQLVAFLGSGMATFGVTLSSVSGLLSTLSTAFAALTGPVGLAVAAIAGAAALIYANWNKVVSFFTQGRGSRAFDMLYKGVAEVAKELKEIWREVSIYLTNLWGDTVDLATEVWSRVGDSILSQVSNIFRFVSELFGNIAYVVGETIDIILDLVQGDWKEVWRGILNISKTAINQFISLLQFFANSIVSALSGIAGAVGLEDLQEKILSVKDSLDKTAESFKLDITGDAGGPSSGKQERTTISEMIKKVKSAAQKTQKATEETKDNAKEAVEYAKDYVKAIGTANQVGPGFKDKMKGSEPEIGGNVDSMSTNVKQTTKGGLQFSEGTKKAMRQYNKRMKKMKRVSAQVSDAVNQSLNKMTVGFAKSIGKLATGAQSLAGVMKGILSTILDLAIRVGKIAVKTGIAVAGIKKALQSLNPVTAIAAGTALIAVASAAKSALSSAAGGSGSGSGPGLSDNGGTNMASLSGGGVTMSDGMAMLHENEVVRDKKVDDKMFNRQQRRGRIEAGEVRLKGSDLYIALKEEFRNRKDSGLNNAF